MANPSKSGAYGEPEEWEFDYPYETLKTAFWLWRMSDFQRLPTQAEIAEYDTRYINDMKLMYHIYSHQSNQTPIMQLFENYEQNQKINEARGQHSNNRVKENGRR